ncbi:MAG TPA: GGDEF domain-containing phosphodiesterase [Burkholderiaceae bacterium]|nr:GGDEF domain-containing phosphodiesterase [Burkholderiaceae bacterium]
MLGPQFVDTAGASRPAARPSAARIVGRSAFEAELAHRCAVLSVEPSGASASGFTILLLRLRRSDRRIKLLATEGADSVLREVLQRVASVLHADDLITACSRDEVAILLSKVGQEGVARLASDRIFRALGRMSIGASLRPQIGAALAPIAGRSIEQVLSAVDVACDAAATAHPRIAFATFDMADHDDDAHLPALQRALDSNALTLAFQPQFDLVRGTWSAMEALIRWPHAPGEVPLSPARLVDLAERHGLMDGLTRLVLNTAMRYAAGFDRHGAQLDLAVNLSPSMMADSALPDRVAQALATWDLAPGRLVLEVTENSIIRDGEATLGVMRRLDELGTRLSIDDFGTGHSSFARMRDMPLAELKIDRLFIASMTTRREDLQIVRSVIDLAHNFELRAIAEGVEDAATFAMLRGMGCDAVQGYFCAKPMSADDLLRWWPVRPRTGFDSP